MIGSIRSEQWLQTVLCPICQVDDAEVIYPSRRRERALRENEFRPSGDTPLEDPLVRCRRCSMQYVNPRTPSELVLTGYASAVDEAFVSQSAGREETFRRCLKTLQSVWRKPPGSLLDIGTANGSFLKVARDAGWTVSGCEPNRWLCEWCERNYGIRVNPGTLFEASYAPGSFDVITLWDVLEHTPDPRAVLQECERLLAPGGLVAVNYPDIGSLAARIMARRWVFLISVHHYYFDRHTIKALLEVVGLAPVLMRPHIQRLSLDYIFTRAEPLTGAVARGLRALTRNLGLGNQLVPYWVGQTLVIAQRKS